MCFSAPSYDFPKQDFGPLPSLRGEDVNRTRDPQYYSFTPRSTAMKPRSLLSPIQRS